MLIAMLEGA